MYPLRAQCILYLGAVVAELISPILRGWEHLGVGQSLRIPGVTLRGKVQLAVAALNRGLKASRRFQFFTTKDGSRVHRMR